MNNINPDSWQKNVQVSLGEISKSLNILATVQALSCLHEKSEIQSLVKSLNLLRAEHAQAIDHLHSLNKSNFTNELEKKSAHMRALNVVNEKHSELRTFQAAHPHIEVLSQFVGETAQ